MPLVVAKYPSGGKPQTPKEPELPVTIPAPPLHAPSPHPFPTVDCRMCLESYLYQRGHAVQVVVCFFCLLYLDASDHSLYRNSRCLELLSLTSRSLQPEREVIRVPVCCCPFRIGWGRAGFSHNPLLCIWDPLTEPVVSMLSPEHAGPLFIIFCPSPH